MKLGLVLDLYWGSIFMKCVLPNWGALWNVCTRVIGHIQAWIQNIVCLFFSCYFTGAAAGTHTRIFAGGASCWCPPTRNPLCSAPQNHIPRIVSTRWCPLPLLYCMYFMGFPWSSAAAVGDFSSLRLVSTGSSASTVPEWCIGDLAKSWDWDVL